MKSLYSLVVIAGCAGDAGGLDQASVATECSPTDVACVTAGLDGPVAVGGIVPLAIDTATLGSSTAALSLVSADPEVLKAADTEVLGLKPGVSALVILAEDTAVDFLHVFVVAPTRVGFHRIEGGLERAELVEDIELLEGDELVLGIEPYHDSQRLVGHTTSTWTASDSLAVLRDGTPGRRRIVARAPGETDLVVEAFGFQKTLHITVVP